MNTTLSASSVSELKRGDAPACGAVGEARAQGELAVGAKQQNQVHQPAGDQRSPPGDRQTEDPGAALDGDHRAPGKAHDRHRLGDVVEVEALVAHEPGSVGDERDPDE